ncbi:methylated-DNA--[protein]-cysteine S-methyltransferase [Sansalvadorimonas verongulae]|uniref:methylated-DNA--[protein]-cysteine S-methyltransferase n=1 Tax=Sansalvadorimonas verongulae TaxID=2172824 RepID=UPI0012BCDA73|nr:methylated-DNA--[protein]-cysteine S-methyltransferase [Sansalvadorimonas verongulae]MTI12933.1 methylated-DNA--[protein]-cysteine S-methyltransferase [Sansalvadorimonas verongulae]
MIYTEFTSHFGTTLAAADNGKLCHVWFPGQKHEPDTSFWQRDDAAPLFAQLKQQLQEYAVGERTVFELPLNLRGTDFQKSVWRALQMITFGQHSTYGTLAKQLGKPKASRAIGAAVGKNPIGIIIPCHRVLGSSGKLTGFAAGLDMKTRLLTLEGLKIKQSLIQE